MSKGQKRAELVETAYHLWENGEIIEVEFDSIVMALYENVKPKQQDRTRLEKFIAKIEDGDIV